MPILRHVAFAAILTSVTVQPTLAQTCNLTIGGSRILDDEACTVSRGKSGTRITVGSGGTIALRRSRLSLSLPNEPVRFQRGKRRGPTSYGRVTSYSNDGKTCSFNQKLVLCIEQ